MAKKRDRIDVLTVRLTVHIQVDSGSNQSVSEAAQQARELFVQAELYGIAEVTTAYGRIVAPAPDPAINPKSPPSSTSP